MSLVVDYTIKGNTASGTKSLEDFRSRLVTLKTAIAADEAALAKVRAELAAFAAAGEKAGAQVDRLKERQKI